MPITTKEQLRNYVHSIHNFIRNQAAYGMGAMKIFMFFYGLKLIEPHLDKLNLKITPFSKLVKLVTDKHKSDIVKADEIISAVNKQNENSIVWELRKLEDENSNLFDILYYDIPIDLNYEFYVEIIKRIDKVPIINKNYDNTNADDIYNTSLTGKVYEYFIGNDQTSISELGAYFTDRDISKFIINEIKPHLNENKFVDLMIDPFGGSGSFTLGYVDYLIEHNELPNNFWTDNIRNVYHYDMNHDVLKISGLEMFSLTHVIPNMEVNFKRTNSFKCEFENKKFKYVLGNPPFGCSGGKCGQSLTNDYKQSLKELKDKFYVKDEKTDKYTWTEKWAREQFDEETKLLKQHQKEIDNLQVNYNTCSKRIKEFVKKYDKTLPFDESKFFTLTKKTGTTCLNDKEACSLILFMELLEKDGICAVVIKEGVFFDNKYANIRRCLINNYNVYKIVSVSSDQFENTTTKTSILFFKNNGKTKLVTFSELILEREPEDVREVVTKDDITRYQLVKRKGQVIKVYDKVLTTATYDEIAEPTEVKTKSGKIDKKYYYSLSYKKYMKDNEIKCSDDYKIVRLADKFIMLPTTKHNTSIGNNHGNYRFYNSSQTKELYLDTYEIDKESIIVGNGGKFNIHYDTKFTPSKHVTVLQTKNNEDKYIIKFAYNMLTQLNNQYNYNGSTIGWLNKETIGNIKIPIPKSKEKLKEWVKKLSKPYDKLQEDREKFKELEKQVQDEIKRICNEEECEEHKLGDICNIKASLGGKSLSKYYTDEQKHGFITGKNLNGNNNFTFINDEGYIICKNSIVKKGDLLIPEVYNFNSKTVMVPSEWNKFVFKGSFRISEFKINSYYLLWYLNTPLFTLQATNASQGSIFEHVSISILENISIKVPTDKKLLETLDKQFKKIEELQETIKKTEEKYKNLLQELKDEAIIKNDTDVVSEDKEISESDNNINNKNNDTENDTDSEDSDDSRIDKFAYQDEMIHDFKNAVIEYENEQKEKEKDKQNKVKESTKNINDEKQKAKAKSIVQKTSNDPDKKEKMKSKDEQKNNDINVNIIHDISKKEKHKSRDKDDNKDKTNVQNTKDKIENSENLFEDDNYEGGNITEHDMKIKLQIELYDLNYDKKKYKDIRETEEIKYELLLEKDKKVINKKLDKYIEEFKQCIINGDNEYFSELIKTSKTKINGLKVVLQSKIKYDDEYEDPEEQIEEEIIDICVGYFSKSREVILEDKRKYQFVFR